MEPINPVDEILAFDGPRKADPYVRLQLIALAVKAGESLRLESGASILETARTWAEFVEGGIVVDSAVVEAVAGLVGELPGWISGLLSNLIGPAVGPVTADE